MGSNDGILCTAPAAWLHAHRTWMDPQDGCILWPAYLPTYAIGICSRLRHHHLDVAAAAVRRLCLSGACVMADAIADRLVDDLWPTYL